MRCRRTGFYYAPDPSSQIACTIGGNVAENSGGVHCLKYGLTTNNVLGVEFVTMDGEIIRLGGKHFDAGGYDLLGVMVGSEGLLGVVTEVTVRVLPTPPGARALAHRLPVDRRRRRLRRRGHRLRVSFPAAWRSWTGSAIQAAEAFVHASYPLDAEALLIVELDGCAAEVDHLIAAVERHCEGPWRDLLPRQPVEEERLLFWAGRKAAFPAVGRISPDYYCMDGTIPRREIGRGADADEARWSGITGCAVANVFHAGDGNLHPLILYDANKPGELQRAEDFGADILRLCVEVGGVLTGEHGVGVEKRDLMETMFNDTDLNQQQRLKCAFDDDSLLNPGKVFPQLCRCAELGRMHVHAGTFAFSRSAPFLKAKTHDRLSSLGRETDRRNRR